MSYALVPKVNASTSLDTIMEIIDRDGGVIISGMTDEVGCQRLANDVNPLFDASNFCEGLFYGKQTKRVHGLIAKSEVCRSLATKPLVLQVVNKLLTPFCEKIQINLTQGIQIWPGEAAQILHRDDSKFPVQNRFCEFMVNVMWACTKFTKENGCTRVALGSHAWKDVKRRPTEDEISYAEMEPGDALIYLGSVIHGGGENASSASRTGMVMGYCLGWIRQAENQYLVAPPEIAKHFSPQLQDLLGYAVHRPNLGMYEGNEPKILFDTKRERVFITRDWLTNEQNNLVEQHLSKLRASGLQ